MQQAQGDAIAAIATPSGKGGIGIVRLSGPRLGAMARAITGREPVARRAILSPFLDGQGNPIDEGIVLFFPAPASFTGQDVLELQGHGGPVVTRLVLKRCLELGARLAEPGEFTKRAFLNGKLDLAQAESVADIIEASSEAALKCAMRSFRGEFSDLVGLLVSQLVELRMLVEGMLDFPEEELDDLDRQDVERRLAALGNAVNKAVAGAVQGSILRTGLQVVLAGRPNVGKSSLLNRLARDDMAIVTDIPGTTRDALRHTIILEGVPVNIVDTAGLRESADEVERLGIKRSWQNIHEADLLLFVLEADKGLTPEDQHLIQSFPPGLKQVLVFNKADLALPAFAREDNKENDAVYVSAKTGEGMHALEAALLLAAGWRSGNEDIIMARERHLEALRAAQSTIEQAREHLDHAEFLAEELRMAQQQLGSITGEFTADDLLGEIFSRFCIGK